MVDQKRAYELCRKVQTCWVWILISVVVTLSSSAQTVRPLIDENVLKAADKVARGKIEYLNDSLQPLTVTLDVRSFTVSEVGDISYRPVDPGIRLKLSAMSFRIMPQQVYSVWYEASAEQLPAWFVIYATFSGFHAKTPQGFRIQVQLPHTVYLLPKNAVGKDQLALVATSYSTNDKKIIIRVKNTGTTLARVLETEVLGKHTQSNNSGFPIFPQAERQVEISWTGDAMPEKVRLRLERFTLEGPVQTE